MTSEADTGVTPAGSNIILSQQGSTFLNSSIKTSKAEVGHFSSTTPTPPAVTVARSKTNTAPAKARPPPNKNDRITTNSRGATPHTISSPPVEINNPDRLLGFEQRLGKFEEFARTQAEQNRQFQNMVLQAMGAGGDDGDICSHDNDHDYYPFSMGMSDLAQDTDSSQGQAQNAPQNQADDHNNNKDDDNSNTNNNDIAKKQFETLGFAARFAAKGDTGPPIEDTVATSLNYLLHTNIEDSTINELLDKYQCPSNAEHLIVPKVNTTIWESIPPKARSRDLKLQRIQKPLVKGITAMARYAQNGNELDTQGQDAIALLANANFELLCLRKDLLKPEINAKYAHLCRPSMKPTEFLFGDIGKVVKELDEQHKASAGLFKPKLTFPRFNRGSRHNPYSATRGRHNFTNADFLGNPPRGGWHNSRRGMNQRPRQYSHHNNRLNKRLSQKDPQTRDK